MRPVADLAAGMEAALLRTPSGFMVGAYGMETDNGELFDAVIPAFSLDSPHDMSPVN